MVRTRCSPVRPFITAVCFAGITSNTTMSACKVLVALVLVCLSVQALAGADNALDFGPRKLLTADALKGTAVYSKVDKTTRAQATDAAQYCSTQWCYWVTCRNARKAVGYCSNGRCVCE